MLVYDSTGKLVNLEGDQWNSGNLPLGYYATPYQLQQATGIQTGAGGVQGMVAAPADPYNPLGGWANGNTYDNVSAPAGAMGYSWDYATGQPAAHRQQVGYRNTNPENGGPAYSAVPLPGYVPVDAPAPNDPSQYGPSASLTPPPVAMPQVAPAPAAAPATTTFAADVNPFDPASFVGPLGLPASSATTAAPQAPGRSAAALAAVRASATPLRLPSDPLPTAPALDVSASGQTPAQQAPGPQTTGGQAIDPNALKFSFTPLINWVKNPLNPPKPKDPFGGNIQNGSGGGGGSSSDTTSGARDLEGEGANTLAALVDLAPQMFNSYQQYAPQYANVDLQTLKTTLFGQFDPQAFDSANPGFIKAYNDLQAAGELNGWTPEQFAAAYTGKAANDPSLLNFYNGGQMQFNQRLTDEANKQTVASNTALRQGNINDAANLGGQALNTLKSLNPGLYGALNQASQFVGGPSQAAGGASANGLPTAQFGMPVNVNPNAPFVGPTAGGQTSTSNGGASGGIGVSQYQASLGNIFNQGPQFNSVSGATISPNSVAASYNPLLGTTNQQAQNLAPSALGSDLSNMARQQLALGGTLSDEQKRNATQAAREAYGARGLINSNSAVAQEILNRDAYSQQLLNQRMGMAANVNQLEQGQQGLNNAFLFNALGANATQGAQNLQAGLANQQNNYNSQLATAQFGQQAQMANQGAGLQAQQMNQSLGTTLAGLDYSRQQQNFGNIMANAQLQSANAFNPFSTITSAGSANQGTNPVLFGQGASGSSGAMSNQNVMNMFNPFNSYASDFYNTNLNAAASDAASAANNKAAKQSAMIAGGASLAGAAIIAL